MGHKLCFGTGAFYNVPVTEQMKYIKDAGFDMVFSDWDDRHFDFEPVARAAADAGLALHSIHAPFYACDDIWEDDEGNRAGVFMQALRGCIDDCVRFGVGLMISHVIIGMERCTPNELGLERFGEIIDYAADRGITIAFENTEGEEYLKAVLDRYGGRENVGFCYDSGHELCYNAGRDMLAEYGRYLVSTHLNDNLGMLDPAHKTFLDDSHLLPFDGIADWEGIAARLHGCGFDSTLTFETCSSSKPGRTANDRYAELTFEEYLAAAYERAVRFRDIFEKGEI